jgi:hypothetical protein
MSQLGETVGKAVFTDPTTCPFCSAKEDKPKTDTHVLINDSGELSDNCSGMPDRLMQDVETDATFYIWEKYWPSGPISKTQSLICMNAHHVIPGNASLAECSAILKWVADTVTFRKHFYEDADVAKKKRAAGRYRGRTEPGDPPKKIKFKLNPTAKKGGFNIVRDETVKYGHVTGKVDYNLNDKANGEWLPSNNAVANWSEVKGVSAKNIAGKSTNFGNAYAHNAMHATGQQFHDSHGAYSLQVYRELLALEKKIEKRSEKCKGGCPASQARSRNAKRRQPAPPKLKKALDDLAADIKPKLKGGKPKGSWFTSKLSKEW